MLVIFHLSPCDAQEIKNNPINSTYGGNELDERRQKFVCRSKILALHH